MRRGTRRLVGAAHFVVAFCSFTMASAFVHLSIGSGCRHGGRISEAVSTVTAAARPTPKVMGRDGRNSDGDDEREDGGDVSWMRNRAEPVDEEDEMEDELQDIVKVDGREGGTAWRQRKRSPTLQWLKDLYHKIFWFGLNMDDDDEEDFLDEIDWLEEWNSPHEIGGGPWDDLAEERPAKGTSFPFDMMYGWGKERSATSRPSEAAVKRERVRRQRGAREEEPAWRNVRDAHVEDEGDEYVDDGDMEEEVVDRQPRRTRVVKERSDARENARAKITALEEKMSVLGVSRDVWKGRIAEMLRSNDPDVTKLTRARSRLQDINSELAELEIELDESKDVERRRERRERGASGSERKYQDEGV